MFNWTTVNTHTLFKVSRLGGRGVCLHRLISLLNVTRKSTSACSLLAAEMKGAQNFGWPAGQDSLLTDAREGTS